MFTERTSESASKDGSRRPTRFIVFGNQRTGSTLVSTRLNSHSHVICFEEVFLPWVDSNPSLREWLDTNGYPQWMRVDPRMKAAFVSSLFDSSTLPTGIEAVGFKVMYNQLSLWPKLAYFMPRTGQLLCDHKFQKWLRDNRVVIIHTLRRNRLKVLVSHELAAQTGRFHSRDGGRRNSSVVIPLRGLKARLSRIEAAEKVARKVIEGLPVVEITYEDYVGPHGIEVDARVCAALGQSIPARGLTSQLTKVSSDDLRDTITNYAQVAAYLSGSRYECFLK